MDQAIVIPRLRASAEEVGEVGTVVERVVMETLPTDGGGGGGSGRVSGLSNTQMSSGQRFGNGYATITLVE